MSSYFCLDEVFTAAEAGIDEVFCEITGRMQRIEEGQLVWVCFAGLPMGWSWALCFARESLRKCSTRAFARLGAEPQLVVDHGPPPRPGRGAAFSAPYIDNGYIIGFTREATASLADALEKELLSSDFALHTRKGPDECYAMVDPRHLAAYRAAHANFAIWCREKKVAADHDIRGRRRSEWLRRGPLCLRREHLRGALRRLRRVVLVGLAESRHDLAAGEEGLGRLRQVQPGVLA